ncbi:MAG TPA: hypothetical protein VFR37_14735 [Longimicrobium sp.]|nr:hypothetical protein [Longimicrobium sp.]
MLHGSVSGTPEQRVVATEIWHDDLPDLLETLERTQLGDFKEKSSLMGCVGGIFATVVGVMLAILALMSATSEADSIRENVKQEAVQRCAELGGTYAEGGARVGGRTIYCILRPGAPAPPAVPSDPFGID